MFWKIFVSFEVLISDLLVSMPTLAEFQQKPKKGHFLYQLYNSRYNFSALFFLSINLKHKLFHRALEMAPSTASTASSFKESWNIISGQDHNNNGEDILVSGCSTPKAQRFRIPEMSSCPPPPKKRRVSSTTSSCVSNLSPMNFFAPPDIELFFFLAFQNIPA